MAIDLTQYKNKSPECIACGNADIHGGLCIGKTDLSLKCLIRIPVKSPEERINEAKEEIRRLLT